MKCLRLADYETMRRFRQFKAFIQARNDEMILFNVSKETATKYVMKVFTRTGRYPKVF